MSNNTRTKTIASIAILTLKPHPLNAKIYDSTTDADEELKRAIVSNGGQLVHAPVVHLRLDGEYRILSGHRRIRMVAELGHEQVECVVWEGLTDADEMLTLFIGNVGRDMKVGYKVHFYSQLKQFLRQLKSTPDKSGAYDDAILQNNPFVHAVNGILKSGEKRRIWEIIEELVGFSKREQEALTHVCDIEYRESVVAPLSDENKKTILRQWENLEHGVVSGKISIAKASKMVDSLREQIKELNTPPPKKSKGKKETAIKEEMPIEINASIYANTLENIASWLKKQPAFKQDINTTLTIDGIIHCCHDWAKLVMEEAK